MKLNILLVSIGIILLIAIISMCKRHKSPFLQTSSVSSLLSAKNDTITDSTVLIFYAPWCGYCKKSMPVFTEASEKESNILLINADLDENKELVKKYQIKGFPTIVRGDGTVFSGERSVTALIDFYNNK